MFKEEEKKKKREEIQSKTEKVERVRGRKERRKKGRHCIQGFFILMDKLLFPNTFYNYYSINI